MARRLFAMTAVGTALTILMVIFAPAVVDTQGQKKPDQVTKRESQRGGTADPNVKDDNAVNEKGKASGMPAPAAKAGEKPRQALCSVMFDNYTDLWIKAYVDGRYAGTMRPWGELYTYAVAGPTQLYGRADYRDGSYDTWGPIRISCNTSFSWELR